MNLSGYFTSLTKLEIGILFLFIAFLVSDIEPHESIASMIDNPIGMAVVLIITLYMFVVFNPVLGVVGIFVAYELIRRSSKLNNRVAASEYTPSQHKKDMEIKAMNPPTERTLEEEMVGSMAPIGKSSSITYTTSEFKPVSNDTHGASLVM